MDFKKNWPLLSFVGIWILMAIVVNPIGDFSINDDWAYAHNVKSLVEDNKLHFSDWPAMTLISQTMWGALIGKLFGFSFTALRFGTLLLALLSGITFYKIVFHQTKQQFQSWLATVVLFANPFFISLSFTFMTEIPYLFLLLLSILLYMKYNEDSSRKWYILFIVVGILTVLLRQTALLLFIVFALMALINKQWNWKRLVWAILPIVLGLISIEVYKYIRTSSGYGMGTFSSTTDLFRSLGELPFKHYYTRAGLIFLTIGLVSLPVIGITIRIISRNFSWLLTIRFVFVLLLIVPAIQLAWDQFPAGNLLHDFGLGPKLLKDTTHHYNDTAGYYPNFWRTLKYLSSISVILVAFALNCAWRWKRIKQFHQENCVLLFVYVLAMAELAYLMINPIFFDRYILVLAALILLLLLLENKSTNRLMEVLPIAVVLMTFGTFLTKDFMNWNRAKLEAFHYATKELHIPKTKLDGGFELNAWNQVAPIGEINYDKWAKSWWFVVDDEYAICNGDYPGYKKLRGFVVGNVITPGPDSIYLLRRYTASHPIDHAITIDFEHFSDRGRQVLSSNEESFMFVNSSLVDMARSGQHALVVNEDFPFAISYKVGNTKVGDKLKLTIWVRGDRGKLVVETVEDQPKKLGFVSPMKQFKNQWQQLLLEVEVDDSTAGKELNIFYMNTHAQLVWVDDLVIQRKSDH